MLWNEKCIQHLILLLDLPLRNPFRAMLMLSLEHTTPHFISALKNWCLKGCTNFFREWQVRETPSNLSPEQSKSANDSLFNRVTSAVNLLWRGVWRPKCWMSKQWYPWWGTLHWLLISKGLCIGSSWNRYTQGASLLLSWHVLYRIYWPLAVKSPVRQSLLSACRQRDVAVPLGCSAARSWQEPELRSDASPVPLHQWGWELWRKSGRAGSSARKENIWCRSTYRNIYTPLMQTLGLAMI